jgi:hypothetical protein
MDPKTPPLEPDQCEPAPFRYLSAKAARPGGLPLTDAEIEAAEEEALAWSRLANRC